jgi:hypothetical protein
VCNAFFLCEVYVVKSEDGLPLSKFQIGTNSLAEKLPLSKFQIGTNSLAEKLPLSKFQIGTNSLAEKLPLSKFQIGTNSLAEKVYDIKQKYLNLLEGQEVLLNPIFQENLCFYRFS